MAPAQAHQAVSWLKSLALQGLQGLHTAAPALTAPLPAPERLPAPALQALAQDITQRLGLPGAATQVVLQPHRADVFFSLPLQAVPGLGAWLPSSGPSGWPRWLNLSVSLQQRANEPLPQVQALRLGRVALPTGPRAQALALWAAQRLGWQPRLNQLVLALAAVQQVDIQPQGVAVQLLPPWLLGQKLGPLLMPRLPLERLQPYCQRLVQVLQPPTATPGAASAPEGPVPLHTLLQPLLTLAAAQASPAAQAQAFQLATVATALYATQLPPALLAPGFLCPLPPHRVVELGCRHDHALHWLLSALLAQGAHPMLADAVGLYKELADLGDPKGSGFSFDDLAADRAGASFGLLTRQAPGRVAAHVAAIRSDAFLMPSVQGLPSQLSHQQLQAELGGYGSTQFQAWMAEVERRVQRVPMLGP